MTVPPMAQNAKIRSYPCINKIVDGNSTFIWQSIWVSTIWSPLYKVLNSINYIIIAVTLEIQMNQILETKQYASMQFQVQRSSVFTGIHLFFEVASFREREMKPRT